MQFEENNDIVGCGVVLRLPRQEHGVAPVTFPTLYANYFAEATSIRPLVVCCVREGIGCHHRGLANERERSVRIVKIWLLQDVVVRRDVGNCQGCKYTCTIILPLH